MNKLNAGIARSDITPALGTTLFGYGPVRIGDEVADGLAATALVLRSGTNSAAIISLDWGQVDEEETSLIRDLVAEKTSISPHNVTVCASHTHSAPATVKCWGFGVKDVSYLEAAREKIVQAVVAAEQALQPVRAGIGVTETDIGINRREVMPDGTVNLGFNEWGPRDRDLTVIRFEGKSGTVAQIVHLSAHPTARGFDPAISRDWPGVMIDRVETVTHTPVLFINGSFGDVAPRTSIGGAVGDGEAASQEIGLRAAGDALRAFREIRDFRELDMETLRHDFELPLAPLPPLDEALSQRAAYAVDRHATGDAECEWNFWNAVCQAHQEAPRKGRSFSQIITRLGPVAIVPFAGEIFSEIALRLKKASPFAHTLCAGSSNGGHGYYVTREARGRGGFEIRVARAYSAYMFADNIDDVLVAENLKLLQRMKSS